MTVFKSLRLIALTALLAAAALFAAPTAYAGDPVIDAAKARGVIGERMDGYLGFVVEGSEIDVAVRRKVNEVNAGRRALYERTARDTNTTIEQVGIVTGQKQISGLPSGQYYMNQTGQWIRK